MPLLADIDDRRLYPGDILRLPDNYDLGPGSGPVDLLVVHLRDESAGCSLVVASGYKAGLVLHTLPRASGGADGLGLDVGWLLANWDAWFVFTYHPGRIPVEKALVLRKDARTLPEET